MRQILAILKLQLDNRFAIFKKSNIKTRLLNILKYAIIFGAIFGVCCFIISKISFFLVISFNQELFAIVLSFLLIISLIFSISNVISTMFMSKDNELLLCLPVSFDQLYVSKLVVLYINELVFNILYIFPILLALGTVGIGIPAIYFLVIVLLFPILPFASLGIASLLAIPVMSIVKFLMDRPKVSVVVSIVGIAALFVLYMLFITSISGAFNITEQQIETSVAVNQGVLDIGSKIPVIYWLSSIFFNLKTIYKLYIFMAAFIVLFVASALIVRKIFFKISVFNNNFKKATRAKKRVFKKRSIEKELLLKEFRTCLRSPSIIVQFFLFPLLMPLIVYTYDKLLFSIAVNQTGQALIFASHVLVLFMVTTLSSSITSTALSREGGLLYFSKMIPVSYEKQALIKIVFNTIISWAAILITTVVCCIFNETNIVLIILASIAALITSVGHICQSYDIDLRNPTLDWYDVGEISALSKNTTSSILFGFLVAIIFTLFSVLGRGSNLLTGVLLIVPAIIYTAGRVHLLRLRLKIMFGRIEI